MARIKLHNLPKNEKVSNEEMEKVMGGGEGGGTSCNWIKGKNCGSRGGVRCAFGSGGYCPGEISCYTAKARTKSMEAIGLVQR